MIALGHGRSVDASRLIGVLPWSRQAWKEALASGHAIFSPLFGHPPRSLIVLDALGGPVLVRSSLSPQSVARRLKETMNAQR